MEIKRARKKRPIATQLREYVREVSPTLTYPIYRSMVRIPALPKGSFVVKLASTQDELEQAYRLIHDVYVDLGFMESSPSGLRLTPHNLLPHTSTIVAVHDGVVVGTVSVIRDNELGLPMDDCFDTSFYRKPGVQVAEINSLAIAPAYRKDGLVMFPLIKYLYEYGLNFLKVDIFQLATPPKREDFYRAILFFEVADERVVQDPFVNGHPMTALYLDLHQACVQCKRAYGDKPDQANLYKFFAQGDKSFCKFPARPLNQVLDPVMSYDLLTYFFKQKTNLLEQLSDRELFALREIYRGTPMTKILREPQGIPPFPPRRRDQRFLVSCPAMMECEDGDESVTLLDVSASGFRISTRYPLRLHREYEFRVLIGNGQSLPILAKPIWNRRRREWGFTLTRSPHGWESFLETLKNQIYAPSAHAA